MPPTIKADASAPPPGPPSDIVQQEVSEPIPNTDIMVHNGVDTANPEEHKKSIYVLPNKSTRGIPPARYSPECVSRTSRYPIGNMANTTICNTHIYQSSSIQKRNKDDRQNGWSLDTHKSSQK